MSLAKKGVSTDEGAITSLLTRGVEDIFVKEHLASRLRSGEKLRVKLGIDPTGPAIHLGRAITLRKLRDFQRLGHTAIIIVGDFTALIGDPSDKLHKRPMLSEVEVKNNMKRYVESIGKIIDLSSAEVVYNKSWLGKLTFVEIARLAETFSVQQMSSRRNFKERFEKGEEVSLREFMYPLMQGYDSVAVGAHVEIGGFDQLFNVKAGRSIQKEYSLPEQDVLTVEMLEGTDGRKMTTTWGNVITITDEPSDMYGKVMSLRDELISKYFVLCTDLSMDEIQRLEKEIAEGANPKEIKMRLAREIVSLYHGQKASKDAEDNFIATFEKGRIPENIPVASAQKGALLSEVLLTEKIVSSKSEFRRLMEEGAISNIETKEKLKDPHVVLHTGLTLRVGSTRFLKINVQ